MGRYVHPGWCTHSPRRDWLGTDARRLGWGDRREQLGIEPHARNRAGRRSSAAWIRQSSSTTGHPRSRKPRGPSTPQLDSRAVMPAHRARSNLWRRPCRRLAPRGISWRPTRLPGSASGSGRVRRKSRRGLTSTGSPARRRFASSEPCTTSEPRSRVALERVGTGDRDSIGAVEPRSRGSRFPTGRPKARRDPEVAA